MRPPAAQVASRGDTSMAVTLLTKYVSLYVNDLEAWEELAAMYLQVRKGVPGSAYSPLHVCGITAFRPPDKLDVARDRGTIALPRHEGLRVDLAPARHLCFLLACPRLSSIRWDSGYAA